MFNKAIDKNHSLYFLVAKLAEAKLVLTIDGLYEVGNSFPKVEYVGSFLSVDNKIYRPAQFTEIGNWFDWIVYCKYNNTSRTGISEYILDLDDGNCCADGIIGVRNENGHHTCEFVPFNMYVHDLIKAARKQ